MARRKYKYAENTKVSVSRSREEIEKLLKKNGAAGFSYGWMDGAGRMEFLMKGLRIRIDLPRLDIRDLTEKQAEQEERRQWRALLLILKAKLESIESGISIFEEEFLAFVVLPDGTKVGDRVIPELAAVAQGKFPLSLEKPEASKR